MVESTGLSTHALKDAPKGIKRGESGIGSQSSAPSVPGVQSLKTVLVTVEIILKGNSIRRGNERTSSEEIGRKFKTRCLTGNGNSLKSWNPLAFRHGEDSGRYSSRSNR